VNSIYNWLSQINIWVNLAAPSLTLFAPGSHQVVPLRDNELGGTSSWCLAGICYVWQIGVTDNRDIHTEVKTTVNTNFTSDFFHEHHECICSVYMESAICTLLFIHPVILSVHLECLRVAFVNICEHAGTGLFPQALYITSRDHFQFKVWNLTGNIKTVDSLTKIYFLFILCLVWVHLYKRTYCINA